MKKGILFNRIISSHNIVNLYKYKMMHTINTTLDCFESMLSAPNTKELLKLTGNELNASKDVIDNAVKLFDENWKESNSIVSFSIDSKDYRIMALAFLWFSVLELQQTIDAEYPSLSCFISLHPRGNAHSLFSDLAMIASSVGNESWILAVSHTQSQFDNQIHCINDIMPYFNAIFPFEETSLVKMEIWTRYCIVFHLLQGFVDLIFSFWLSL